jgi:hypothetical protein
MTSGGLGLSIVSSGLLPLLPIVSARRHRNRNGPGFARCPAFHIVRRHRLFVARLGFPLLALGLVSREAMMRWRHRMAGHGLKAGFGAILVPIGALVITGLDKMVETALVEASPQWLTALTTRF